MDEAPKKKPKPLKKIQSTCVKVERNTHDTVTLSFDTGDQPDYDAGQFISIDPHQFVELSRVIAYFEHIKGKREKFRAYSMSSAPKEKLVTITVKAEPWHKEDKFPPLLSPFLASEHMLGRPVMFTGYTGPLHPRRVPRPRHGPGAAYGGRLGHRAQLRAAQRRAAQRQA